MGSEMCIRDRCGAVFVTYNRHNSSRKGFREKDPGYVGARANKDLRWDLCTESNIPFGVLFHYQRQRENVADMARDASTRNPQSFSLRPVSYLMFFKTLTVYLSTKSPTDMHVRKPCDRDRNEEERYQNMKIKK